MSILASKKMKTIIIIGLVAIAVVAVWAVKNTLNDSTKMGTGNPDFALDVTEKLDLEHLKSYGLPIIIDFGADYCQPCREFAPILKTLNEEYQGKAIIRYVDVAKYQELADGFPVSVIPTQILIDASGNPYVPRDASAIPMKMYSDQNTGLHTYTAHEGGLTKTQAEMILKEMGIK